MDYSLANIETLLLLCEKNNYLAQLEVYNRYYKAMYTSALHILKNKMEAEDIMQNAFIIAFNKLPSLDDKAKFGAWLKRIVINQSITAYNKKRKQKTIALDAVIHKIETVDETPFENANKSVKITQMKQVLSTLKDSYRIVLSLYYLEGYDYEEICSLLNINYGNCRTLLSRAKESLRTKLNH